jgi:hypothetical protein
MWVLSRSPVQPICRSKAVSTPLWAHRALVAPPGGLSIFSHNHSLFRYCGLGRVRPHSRPGRTGPKDPLQPLGPWFQHTPAPYPPDGGVRWRATDITPPQLKDSQPRPIFDSHTPGFFEPYSAVQSSLVSVYFGCPIKPYFGSTSAVQSSRIFVQRGTNHV